MSGAKTRSRPTPARVPAALRSMLAPCLMLALLAPCSMLALLACGDDSGTPAGVGSGNGRDGGNGMDATTDTTPTPPGDGDGDGDTGDGDGDGDTGDGDTGDGDGDTGDGDGDTVTDEEDAGAPGCPNDCQGLGNDCNTVKCNLDTLECELTQVADDTPCGSQELNNCTFPDRCSAGVCLPRHASSGTICGDQNVVCRKNDACDGNGVCVDSGLEEVGTACGDATDRGVCDRPDTCNASGNCSPNHGLVETECGSEQACLFAPKCNGTGTCLSALPKPSTTSCGPDNEPVADRTFCHPRPILCDGAGGCDTAPPAVAGATPTLRDGLPCTTNGSGAGDDTECNKPDTCVNYRCDLNHVADGVSCTLDGGPTPDGVCHTDNTCNGGGECTPDYAENNVECGTADASGCEAAPLCNGLGTCRAPVLATDGTLCGDQANVDCNGPNTCDGAGVCLDNFWDLDTSCGDGSDTECTDPDTCNAAGACLANHATAGTACGDQGATCVNDDECDGSGACTDQGFTTPCDISGTVFVGGGNPLGIGISLLGSATSTTTDANGDFTLALPLDQDILLQIDPQAGFYGAVFPLNIAPENAGQPIEWSLDADDAVQEPADFFARTVDLNKGVLIVQFEGTNFEGDEGASISAAAQAPIVDGSGGLLESSTLMSTSGGEMFLYDVATGTTTLTLDAGVNGTCTSSFPGIVSWPVVAHTVTWPSVQCE